MKLLLCAALILSSLGAFAQDPNGKSFYLQCAVTSLGKSPGPGSSASNGNVFKSKKIKLVVVKNGVTPQITYYVFKRALSPESIEFKFDYEGMSFKLKSFPRFDLHDYGNGKFKYFLGLTSQLIIDDEIGITIYGENKDFKYSKGSSFPYNEYRSTYGLVNNEMSYTILKDKHLISARCLMDTTEK